MRTLASVFLVALLAVGAAASEFASCDDLEGKLTAYRQDIAGIQSSLASIKSVANLIDPLGAISCDVKQDVCKLSSTLTKIDTIGSKLKSIPNIGTVMNAMALSAKSANVPAKALCNQAKVLCDSLPGAATLARVYIQQYPTVKSALTVTDGACQAGLVTVDAATSAAAPFCDGSDVDSSCAAVLSQIEATEAAAKRLKEELEKLVSQQLEAALQQVLSALNSLAGALDNVMPSLDVIGDIFDALDALNLPSMPGCTPAVPEVCTPGVPKQCLTVSYPCGVKTKCCGKILGKCVCKEPVTKWCNKEECTPAVPPQCTPAVPEFCPMQVAIDELFSALGINGLPSLPGLEFLNVNLPSLPRIGFYEVDLTFDLPNLFEEISLELPSLPDIDFDAPNVSFTFPTCLAV